jgi:hypothetical protein
MASGTLEKFKTRPRLRPFSITMAKAVASVTVAALHNIQSGKKKTFSGSIAAFYWLILKS